MGDPPGGAADREQPGRAPRGKAKGKRHSDEPGVDGRLLPLRVTHRLDDSEERAERARRARRHSPRLVQEDPSPRVAFGVERMAEAGNAFATA
jgi:hypothetical protein